MAKPSTSRVHHGGAGNYRGERSPAVNGMALIAAAHAGQIEVLDSRRFGGAQVLEGIRPVVLRTKVGERGCGVRRSRRLRGCSRVERLRGRPAGSAGCSRRRAPLPIGVRPCHPGPDPAADTSPCCCGLTVKPPAPDRFPPRRRPARPAPAAARRGATNRRGPRRPGRGYQKCRLAQA